MNGVDKWDEAREKVKREVEKDPIFLRLRIMECTLGVFQNADARRNVGNLTIRYSCYYVKIIKLEVSSLQLQKCLVLFSKCPSPKSCFA